MSTTTSNCGCCSFNPWPHVGEMHTAGLDYIINALFGGSSSSSAYGAAITEQEFMMLACTLAAEQFANDDPDPDPLINPGKPTNPFGQILCSILPNTVNSYGREL